MKASCNTTTKARTHYSMMAALSSILSLGLLLASPLSIAGEYYKWVDEEGVVHFSERPPEGDKKAERLRTLVRDPVVEDVPDTVNEKPEKTEAEKVAEEHDKRPKRLQTVSYKDPAKCQSERTRLKALQSNQRIRVTNDDGSFSMLDEKDIKAEIARTRRAISVSC